MKKKFMASLLSLTLLLSLNVAPAFAASYDEAYADGSNGRLWGYATSYGQDVQIETTIDTAGHLYMHSVIEHNDTGAYVGTPAYTEDYGVNRIFDPIDLSHWMSSFTSNHTYAVYTTHEFIGTQNYAAYTVVTGTYTP
ncbi:MAG: hypothetical protein E7255_06475 [Lachnospiraceae bacterium]|nr:hypothetical protein [Lachnospiraceae bacterium]